MNGSRIRVLSTWVFAINLWVLVMSGFWVMWFYKPTESLAWADIQTLHTSVTFGLMIRNLHRRSGILMFLTATLCFVANAVYTSPREEGLGKWLRVAICVSVSVSLFGATVSRVYLSGLSFDTGPFSTNTLERWYFEHIGPSIVGLSLLLVVAILAARNWWVLRRSPEFLGH